MVSASGTSEWPSGAPPSTICLPWSRRLLPEPSLKVSLKIQLTFVRHLIVISSPGLPNIFWRARKSFFTVVPPFILSYLIFTETEKEHDRCHVQFVLCWANYEFIAQASEETARPVWSRDLNQIVILRSVAWWISLVDFSVYSFVFTLTILSEIR